MFFKAFRLHFSCLAVLGYVLFAPSATAEDSLPFRAHVINADSEVCTASLLDVDGDGRLDIVSGEWWYAAPDWQQHKLLNVELNSTPHVDDSILPVPEQLAGHGIGYGDVNGDGRIDVISTHGWNESPGNPLVDPWLWHPDFRLASDASEPILSTDVDGDGDIDLVWGRGHNVGIYWTEQRPLDDAAKVKNTESQNLSKPVLTALTATGKWVTHAIDTSWSCASAPILADLDGDGIDELVVGKSFQGHEGQDPGENDPLVLFSYQFDPASRTFRQRTVSRHPKCGLDLDPKCVDIDGDGDLDILAVSRSGLVMLENLRIDHGPAAADSEDLAATESPLPVQNTHQDFTAYVPTSANAPATPLTTPLQMGDRRRQIQRQMELVMGPLPSSDRRVALDVKVDSTEAMEKYTRVLLSYVPEAGDRVPAWLLIPHDLVQPAPAMLCLHPTHFELGKDQLLGLGGNVSRFYAHELAERGMVCLVPDYPGFGKYPYDFAAKGQHYDSGTMKAIWNNIRGVDLLESLPCVKPDAIGCIGHSLGGHNALYTAAFDLRLRAVVTSCGFNAFEDYYAGNLKGWTSDRYMPRIAHVYGSDPRRMPFDFPEVLAAIAPRPLFVNAPLHDANFEVTGVRKCQAAVEPVYQLLGKSGNVRFEYPAAEHDFPDTERLQSYDWLQAHLAK